MANVFYYLKVKKSKSDQPVILGFNCVDGKLKYYLPIKINPKNWDFGKSRVKNVIEVQNKDALNDYLTDLERFVNATAELTTLQKSPILRGDLKDKIFTYLNPAEKPKRISFVDFAVQMIADCKTGIKLKDGKKMSTRTTRNYQNGLNGLLEYQKERKIKLDWPIINLNLWEDYTQYLTIEKGYFINTVGSFQKNFIVFLKEARRKKIFNEPFIDEVKILSEDADDVYLDEAELDKIYKHDFTDNPKLERQRDVFIVACHVGFRIGDWDKIKPENFKRTKNGNEYVEIIMEKVGKIATSPLDPIVKDILAKYDNKLPLISDQKFNDYIKEVCLACEIDSKVNITATIGGQKVTTTYEKWTQISSHTARRSFATNKKRAGVDNKIIMKATGHTTEKSFLKYLKLDNEEYMDMLAEHNAR